MLVRKFQSLYNRKQLIFEFSKFSVYFNLFSVKIQNFNVAFSLILPERVFMGGPFKLPVYFVL